MSGGASRGAGPPTLEEILRSAYPPRALGSVVRKVPGRYRGRFGVGAAGGASRSVSPLTRRLTGRSKARASRRGHTIAGAFQAVRGASTEESIIQEGLGFVQGMFRDRRRQGAAAGELGQGDVRPSRRLHGVAVYVGRDWFYDLNSYTSAELVGGSIGILAVVFQWNRADTESFSRMVGSMGVAAVISANPLLLVIMVVAFARAFQRSRMDSQYGDLVDGSVRGAVVATLTIFAVAQVAMVGGPVSLPSWWASWSASWPTRQCLASAFPRSADS